MPKHRSEKVNDRKQQLIEKIAECETVVREFKGSEAWRIILKDIADTEKTINDSWHLVFDKEKLDQFRVTKLATRQLLTTVEKYQSDLEVAKQEMRAIDNPNEILNKYYDSENPNNES